MERMYVLEFIQYKSMTTSFIVPGHVRNAWCSISQITIALLKEEDWNWNVNKVANPLKVFGLLGIVFICSLQDNKYYSFVLFQINSDGEWQWLLGMAVFLLVVTLFISQCTLSLAEPLLRNCSIISSHSWNFRVHQYF